MSCRHEDFMANVHVHRLEDLGKYQAEITLACTQCGVPFRFVGLPCGVDLNGAAVSVDGTEARLAIAPKGEVLSVVDGAPVGFTVRRIEQ